MGRMETGTIYLAKATAFWVDVRQASSLRIIAYGDTGGSSPRLPAASHIAIDDVRILPISHQRKPASLTDTLQRLLTVYQHVAVDEPIKRV